MINVSAIVFEKLSYANSLVIVPTSHPHKAIATIAWLIGIAVCTLLYFLLYHFPVSLHDIAHYITAGVNQIRDHKDLLYPYNPNSPGGMGPSYDLFQNNNIHFDIRTNYPSKLYSTLYGLIYAETGEMRFLYAQWLSLAAIIACNVLLYLIGSRFFSGIALFCFIVSVAFLPVMRFTLNPGSDVFGYFAGLFILWVSVCLRINPFLCGLMAGVLCQFRAQALSIIIALPFVISAIYGLNGKKLLRQVLIQLFGGTVLTYGTISFIYKILIVSNGDSNPIAFYINFFSSSFYGFKDISFIGKKFLDNVLNLFDRQQLFFFAYMLLICISLNKSPVQRGFAIAGIIFLAVPLLIFTFDRSSAPHTRYYMPAVPMVMLAWFLTVKKFDEIGYIRSNIVMVLTAVLVCLGWYSVHGLPVKNMAALDIIDKRLRFLDFQGVETALRDNFNEDDLVIVNHSLPTGLSRLHNVIYIPPFEVFKSGDNREIDGLVFVYSNQSPNDFFKPKDWIVDGKLPDEIKDNNGVTFKKIYAAKSEFPGFEGGIESETYFYIYKNSEAGRILNRDSNGKRIFHAEAGRNLTTLISISPTFDDQTAWGRPFQKPSATSPGVIVGPGPNNLNILYQRFSAIPGKPFIIAAKASSAEGSNAKGRLQVNWLDDKDQLISSSLKVIDVEKIEHAYTTSVVAPAGTKYGVIYVSPHGPQDIVRYTEMKILGK